MMWCSSQNTYPKLINDSLVVITPQQLKATNLIFLEHKKFKLEIPELKKQLTSYESLINSYERTDSVRNAHPQLKQLATGVIDSNDEDAVAKWLLLHYTNNK